MTKIYVATTNRKIKPSKHVIDLQWHGVIDEYGINISYPLNIKDRLVKFIEGRWRGHKVR